MQNCLYWSRYKNSNNVILHACDLRNDEWAQQVWLRIAGAVSDLHAADAQYHNDCMSLFRGSHFTRIARAGKVTENKIQLISIIVTYNQEHSERLPRNASRLVITGPNPTPTIIQEGIVLEKTDLKTTH